MPQCAVEKIFLCGILLRLRPHEHKVAASKHHGWNGEPRKARQSLWFSRAPWRCTEVAPCHMRETLQNPRTSASLPRCLACICAVLIARATRIRFYERNFDATFSFHVCSRGAGAMLLHLQPSPTPAFILPFATDAQQHARKDSTRSRLYTPHPDWQGRSCARLQSQPFASPLESGLLLVRSQGNGCPGE